MTKRKKTGFIDEESSVTDSEKTLLSEREEESEHRGGEDDGSDSDAPFSDLASRVVRHKSLSQSAAHGPQGDQSSSGTSSRTLYSTSLKVTQKQGTVYSHGDEATMIRFLLDNPSSVVTGQTHR